MLKNCRDIITRVGTMNNIMIAPTSSFSRLDEVHRNRNRLSSPSIKQGFDEKQYEKLLDLI